MLLVLLQCASLVSSFAPATRGALNGAVTRPSRSGPVFAAYNPSPQKVKPRKIKEKGPKVKEPPSAAAAQQLVPEQTFWEGPPSITETFIPGLSLLTVVGVIPFSASLARQAWTRYKITNKRLEIASGFQGKDVVQVIWREIIDMKWLRRYGGAAGDLVLTLKDGAKVSCTCMPATGRMGAWAHGRMGAWAHGRVGAWARGRVGAWARVLRGARAPAPVPKPKTAPVLKSAPRTAPRRWRSARCPSLTAT